jgi:CrcB protein
MSTHQLEIVMNLYTCMLIAIGGALGTLCRYGLSESMLPVSRNLPWGTIVINIVGSFVIGFFGTMTLATGKFPVSENMRLFVMVGLCGGFTTFSAFSLQTLDLIRGNHLLHAIANVVLSVTLCIVAVACGHAVAARLNGGASQIAQISIEEEA